MKILIQMILKIQNQMRLKEKMMKLIMNFKIDYKNLKMKKELKKKWQNHLWRQKKCKMMISVLLINNLKNQFNN